MWHSSFLHFKVNKLIMDIVPAVSSVSYKFVNCTNESMKFVEYHSKMKFWLNIPVSDTLSSGSLLSMAIRSSLASLVA